MLFEFFKSAVRMKAFQGGPWAEWLEAFARALKREGYAPLTARGHLVAAAHFLDWTGRTDVSVRASIAPALAGFERHLRRSRCRQFSHHAPQASVCGVRLFLIHLQDAGLLEPAAIDPPAPAEPPLMTAFGHWMHQQRGTCAATLINYGGHLRACVTQLGDNPATWDAHRLRAFVIEGSRTCGWAAAKQRTTALRMFLRFLVADGQCPSEVAAAVPILAHWRLSALPRYLRAEEVERVIASCPGASPVRVRDRAILLLLARLGLRAGDIVQLRLTDLDWRDAWIHVTGKGRRETRLPLTHEVGHALATYIQRHRPPTDSEAVFVRARAPFRPFRSHAVSVMVARAFGRAGVTRPSRGAAHLLRHSVATAMIRQGATLHEVAALLRHRSIATTQIYAKVDVQALQPIAQPWPEVASC